MAEQKEQFAMTQSEVAKELKISRSRVWQIEKAALAKLKKRLIRVGITEDILEE